MRPGRKDAHHEAKTKLRWGSDVYPHLGGFIITDETGVDGDICCADLRQMVTVSIRKETSYLGLVLEAEVLAHYRAGLRYDLSTRLK